MNFAYYPGCSARGSSKDYETSTQAVCKALDIHLVDIPDWNCCGSTPAHAVDTELSAALCVRNLDIAAQQQAELLLTPCPSCLSNLKLASKRMEDNAFRARVDELLDGPSAKTFPPVTSVMQGIAENFDMDAIAARVRKSLKGLKLAAYYGCLMSRPAEIMNFGDPENPTLMESMLTACGAEMVDFPLKTACCGASFGIPERVMTARNYKMVDYNIDAAKLDGGRLALTTRTVNEEGKEVGKAEFTGKKIPDLPPRPPWWGLSAEDPSA